MRIGSPAVAWPCRRCPGTRRSGRDRPRVRAPALIAAAVSPAQPEHDGWQVASAALGQAPQMATDGAGTAVIAGLVGSGLAVRSRPPGGQVGSPGRISDRARPRARVRARRRARRPSAAAWRQGASARTARLRYAVGLTGGRFGAPRALAGTGPLAVVRKAPALAADTPVVAVADDGAALIASAGGGAAGLWARGARGAGPRRQVRPGRRGPSPPRLRQRRPPHRGARGNRPGRDRLTPGPPLSLGAPLRAERGGGARARRPCGARQDGL